MKKMREGYKMTELGEIPEEWKIDYIDNLAKRYSGHTPDKKIEAYWNGNIPWVSLKDTKRLDRRYIRKTEDCTTQEGINNSSAVLLPEGTVVLSRDATVGKVGITDKEMSTSQHFINYVCGEKLNNLYLYYDFLNRKPLFERIGVGSTIKTIGLNFFKSLQIVLPSPIEQQKIASILSSIDDQIEITDNLIEKTKELKKGLMQRLLTKGMGHERFKDTEIGRIPEEWQVKSINEVSEINPRREMVEEDIEVAFIAMEDVSNEGGIIRTNTRRYEEVKKGYTPFKNHDVLLAKITPCFENGKRAIARNLINNLGFGSTEFHVIRSIEENAIPEYLYYTISTSRFMENAKANMTGSAGQKRVPKEFLRQYMIPIPDIKEQQEIASTLSSIDNQIEEYQTKKEKLQTLKKGLMQKLLTGKIRVKV